MVTKLEFNPGSKHHRNAGCGKQQTTAKTSSLKQECK